MRTMTKHQRKSENNENMAIVSSHSPRVENFLAHESLQQTVNICSTNALHAKKGMYILPMLPRSLPVCRMFWLSSCLYQKQPFNTRLDIATKNSQKLVCQCSSITSKQKIISVTTLDCFKALLLLYNIVKSQLQTKEI